MLSYLSIDLVNVGMTSLNFGGPLFPRTAGDQPLELVACQRGHRVPSVCFDWVDTSRERASILYRWSFHRRFVTKHRLEAFVLRQLAF